MNENIWSKIPILDISPFYPFLLRENRRAIRLRASGNLMDLEVSNRQRMLPEKLDRKIINFDKFEYIKRGNRK